MLMRKAAQINFGKVRSWSSGLIGERVLKIEIGDDNYEMFFPFSNSTAIVLTSQSLSDEYALFYLSSPNFEFVVTFANHA